MVVGCIFFTTSCSTQFYHSYDVGLTAKVHDKTFNKNNAKNYNFELEADDIVYKDRNGNIVNLDVDDKERIIYNVNNCLVATGYSINNSKNKKTIRLKLSFEEKDTPFPVLYNQDEMVKKFPNYDYQKYEIDGIGPLNRQIILDNDRQTISNIPIYDNNKNITKHSTSYLYNEYKVGDELYYFPAYTNYSVFAGLDSDILKIDKEDESHTGGWLKHFFISLSGEIDGKNIFTNLFHQKIPRIWILNDRILEDCEKNDDVSEFLSLSKRNSDRENIVELASKNICMFIGDNIDDFAVGLKKVYNTTKQECYRKNGRKSCYDKYIVGNPVPMYRDMKNKSNGKKNNYFLLKQDNDGEAKITNHFID